MHKTRDPRKYESYPYYGGNILWHGEFRVMERYERGEIDNFEANQKISFPQLNFGWHRVVLEFDLLGMHGPENRFVLFYHCNDRGDPEEAVRKNFREIRRTSGNVMRDLPKLTNQSQETTISL